MSTRRHATTVSAFPFSASRGTGSAVTAPRTRRIVDSDTRISRGRRRLEPLRDDDGVARGERLALRRVAGDHLAGIDSDADEDPDAENRVELLVQLVDRSAEVSRGANRAERVVLVDDRDPEGGHDRVADELLDRAAVVLEHALCRLEVA